jgi:hypothetical protein
LGALRGRSVEAARLIGFVDAEIAAAGEIRQPTEQQVRDKLAKLLVEMLPADRIEACVEDGAAWTEQEAIDYTLRYVAIP